MSGLNASLMTAMQALLAQQGALNTTTNNIANANTPGYSRQTPILTAAAPVQEGSLLFGNGVDLQGFQSVRDQLLEMRIQEETQGQSSAEAEALALQQIEPIFTSTGQDIGSQMSVFFSSLSKLSTDASNLSLRQGVLTAAQNLASTFHITAAGLNRVQSGLNTSVVLDVDHINQLTQQFANINKQLLTLQAAGQDGGSIKDQQSELLRQLSQMTDVSVVPTEQGYTLTTASGAALVVGGTSFALQTSLGDGGLQRVFAQGRDITGSLNGGHLGGTVRVRDQFIPGLQDQLDSFASEFAAAFNRGHQAGLDLSGNPGQAFFSTPATVAGTAARLSVTIQDPSQIAASSDGAAGSNGNLAGLIAVRDGKLDSGQSPVDTYASLVFQVGSLTADSKTRADASSLSLQQLSNQRSAVSGVSIDEETTNLIRYQRAYEAAARLITTIDQLNQTILNMGAH